MTISVNVTHTDGTHSTGAVATPPGKAIANIMLTLAPVAPPPGGTD